MPRSKLPAEHRIVAVAQVAAPTDIRGRWQYTVADVGRYRLAEGTIWHKVNGRIQLAVDTSCRIGVGDQLAFRGWFHPIDTTGSGYGELMRRRGVFGRLFVTSENLLERAPHLSRTPVYYAARLQEAALSRLEELRLESDVQGVVTAMVAGDKSGIAREIREDYSVSGAAHLLAVSGLHVGIVFVLVNLLLYLLPALPRGHVLKNVAAIIAIWIYAMTAGLSPSVVRAALMFSCAQLALATTSYRNALNIMLGSAVVMLALNPNYAGDVSFQLSYVAVFSILLFFGPLYRLLKTRWKAVNVLLSVMIVGIVATAGTAPLVSYWFGTFSVAGVMINPAVIFTAHVIVMTGVLWLLMPLSCLQPIFAWVLSTTAGWQNDLVAWSASLGWASMEFRLPLWSVGLIYLIYAFLAVGVSGRYNAKKPFFQS